jgi:hypothetical protein
MPRPCSRRTPYDAGAGTVGGPDIYIYRKLFHETFCADVPVAQAAVMAATQRALALAATSRSLLG